jgi:hypothetical protein
VETFDEERVSGRKVAYAYEIERESRAAIQSGNV